MPQLIEIPIYRAYITNDDDTNLCVTITEDDVKVELTLNGRADRQFTAEYTPLQFEELCDWYLTAGRKKVSRSDHAVRTKPDLDQAVLVTEQVAPDHNDGPAVWDLVLADMGARDAEGRRKYGTPLQPDNGRDALIDAYQEALDLVVYLRQAIYERDRQ